jgi:hypothetical protein
LHKVVQYYRTIASTELPDYLIMADDDTYINMNTFVAHFSQQDTTVPIATAGCLVRWPIQMINCKYSMEYTSQFDAFYSHIYIPSYVSMGRPWDHLQQTKSPEIDPTYSLPQR